MSRKEKIKRNDPCYCGSGKKYKKCHLKANQTAQRNHAPHLTSTSQASPVMAKKFWKILLIGAVVVGLIGSYWGQGLVFAGSWMILYSVARNLIHPPQVKEDAGDPAALNFGRKSQ